MLRVWWVPVLGALVLVRRAQALPDCSAGYQPAQQSCRGSTGNGMHASGAYITAADCALAIPYAQHGQCASVPLSTLPGGLPSCGTFCNNCSAFCTPCLHGNWSSG